MSEQDKQKLKQLQTFAQNLGLTIWQNNGEYILRFSWGTGIVFDDLKSIETYFLTEYDPNQNTD